MLDVANFAFEEHLVRVVEIDGEPWFVGKDVCRALGLSNTNDALSSLDADERGVANTDPLVTGRNGGGAQDAVIISEPGVYRLVFRSRKAEAERFKRWLAHEVIPAIRKTGRFERAATPPATAAVDDDANLMARVHTVRLARQMWGRAAAQALWIKLGIPTVPEMTAPLPPAHDDETRIADGLACLDHLLDSRIGRLAYRDLIPLAAAADEAIWKLLRENGVRIEGRMFEGETGILVASRSRKLAQVFAATRWAGFGWNAALRALPGVRPSTKHAVKFDRDLASMCVFVPLALVAAPPEPRS